MAVIKLVGSRILPMDNYQPSSLIKPAQLDARILIVDDQEANVLLLSSILEDNGYYNLKTTVDPRQTVSLVKEFQPDLILLDLVMPSLDGYAVMDLLRPIIPPDAYLPILVLTADPTQQIKQRALGMGAKDFLAKPFDQVEVLLRIQNLLETRALYLLQQKQNQVLEEKVREQVILLAISHTLASTLELQPELILDQLHEIIEYNHAGLFSLEGQSLVTLAMRGTQEFEQSMPIRIHLNSPEALISLFNKHQPIRIADVWSAHPQAKFLRLLLNDGAAVLLDEMQSWMWVPLAVKGRIIGGVGVAHENLNHFTAHHADLALSVANQAAITMINAELYANAQALAVLEERQRLAHNLHDAVNQSLFSAGLIAEVLPRLWDRDQAQARQSLEDLRRLTRGAMAEMRALLAELRPSTLTDSDLGDLLHQLGNALEGRTNLPVVVIVAEGVVLPADVQVAFYRVCQEALNNIAKHAKASQVEINLKQDEVVIELYIHDDGLGFDIEKIFSGHYGLDMMRERAEAAGVLLTIKSQPSQGTELTMLWTKESL